LLKDRFSTLDEARKALPSSISDCARLSVALLPEKTCVFAGDDKAFARHLIGTWIV